MENIRIQNIILKQANPDAPFWKAYQSLVSDAPHTAYNILKEAYETAGTSATDTPTSSQGGFTEKAFIAALHSLYVEGSITAAQAIATFIEYDFDMTSMRDIRLSTEEVANLYILYYLDSSIAIDSLRPDAGMQDWLWQRSHRLIDFAQIDA